MPEHSIIPLSRLEAVRVRDAWPNEERNFTPWLATEGLDLLSAEIGERLRVLHREYPVGNYSLDLLATSAPEGALDEQSQLVIIENQFGATDHDHLGKLMTYAAGVGDESQGAKTVILIAEDLREEHQRALEWLNEIAQSSVRFYGVELKLYRIGDSAPAPSFDVIVRPNEVVRARRESNASQSVQDWNLLYVEYWTAFKAFCSDANATFPLQTPRPQSWIESPLGRSGFWLSFNASRRDRWVGCELIIRSPEPAFALQNLQTERSQIEEICGPLSWDVVSTKLAKIRISRSDQQLDDKTLWPDQHSWLLSQGENFYRAFVTRVRSLGRA
jgi:hypothetical protein